MQVTDYKTQKVYDSNAHKELFLGTCPASALLRYVDYWWPVTHEKSKNSLGFSTLVWSAGLYGFPQFDRISLRVMHTGNRVAMRLRVHLDLDSSGL
jgi:hypothetical protein